MDQINADLPINGSPPDKLSTLAAGYLAVEDKNPLETYSLKIQNR